MAMNKSSQNPADKLTKNPKTFNQQHEIIVLVDVKVAKNGSALEAKLSYPDKFTSFNQLALLAAKKRQYPKKEVDGAFIEYWLKKVEIKSLVSPMGTQIKPLELIAPSKISPKESSK